MFRQSQAKRVTRNIDVRLTERVKVEQEGLTVAIQVQTPAGLQGIVIDMVGAIQLAEVLADVTAIPMQTTTDVAVVE